MTPFWGLGLAVILVSVAALAVVLVVSRKRANRHILVYQHRDVKLRLVGEGLLWGSSVIRLRRRDIAVRTDFDGQLSDHLAPLIRPRMVMIVAHGDEQGTFFWEEPRPNIIHVDWWDEVDGDIHLWALGCFSDSCYRTYALESKVAAFLGYQGEIRFNFLNNVCGATTQNLLRNLCRIFENNHEINESFRDEVIQEYQNAYDQIGPRPDSASGNQLTKLFILQQIRRIQVRSGPP